VKHQAPVNDDTACTALFGITAKTSKAQIVRAILESLAFRFYHIFNVAANERGIDISKLHTIRVDGGVSRNSFVMRLIANITGKVLDVPENCDSSPLGAAFLAGIAVKVWKDENEVSSLRKSKCVIEPETDATVKKKALNAYRLWLKAVSRCGHWYTSME